MFFKVPGSFCLVALLFLALCLMVPSNRSDSYHCIYIPVSGKWALGHHSCISLSRKWEWWRKVQKDFSPFKETSAFIFLATLSHMAAPSCKGVWGM